LRKDCIQVVGHPTHPQRLACLMQCIFGKAVLFVERTKGAGSLLLLGTRDGPSRLPRRVCPHAAQAFESFREHGIVELPARFQVPPEAFGLARVDQQRQLQQKGWSLAMALPGLVCDAPALRSLRYHPPAFLKEECSF